MSNSPLPADPAAGLAGRRGGAPDPRGWESLLDGVPAPLVVVDAAGVVSARNQAAVDLVGSSRRLLRGRRVAAALPLDFDVATAVAQVVADESSFVRRDARLLLGPGRERLVAVRIGPLAGPVPGAVLLLDDESGVQREVERTRQAGRLEALGTMAATLAHEIRNPLGAIRGAAQILDGMCDDPDGCEGIAVILREADRLARLVDQVLGVARDNSITRRPVNIHRVLDRVVELLTLELGIDPMAVAAREFDPSLPEVAGSEDRLVQLFFNLAKNGIDASPAGVPVVLRTRLSPVRVRRGKGIARRISVTVLDRGTGMTEAARSRLFTPFFTTKEGGTGLGLALCARIVEEHDGEIEVRRRRDGGTRVEVWLPLAG